MGRCGQMMYSKLLMLVYCMCVVCCVLYVCSVLIINTLLSACVSVVGSTGRVRHATSITHKGSHTYHNGGHTHSLHLTCGCHHSSHVHTILCKGTSLVETHQLDLATEVDSGSAWGNGTGSKKVDAMEGECDRNAMEGECDGNAMEGECDGNAMEGECDGNVTSHICIL